jgi:hypothetical protein
MMEIVLVIIIALVSFAFGMGRTGPRLVAEIWYHGFDNHFCKRPNCCGALTNRTDT